MRSVRTLALDYAGRLRARDRSYAQCGEDRIAAFALHEMGIDLPKYLDIGAHHPTWLGNTFYFYRRGSSGVCVEADPTLLRRIRRRRPRDPSLNVAVGPEDGRGMFHVMKTASLSTLSNDGVEEYRGEARSERFHAAGGDVVLRLGYPLDAASLVFDVGGFEGRWAGDLHSRFGCRIEVFEPGERYAAVAERRFEHNGLVTVHRYGLGADDRMVEMAIDGVSSSAVMARPTDEREAIRLLDVANVMRDLAPSGVDLMKINIEGGEYALLDRLLEAGLISHIRFLQVQFHEDVDRAEARRDSIRERLRATHDLMWEYPWVWESWVRRES
jgi:FkbM family methyltransferase